MQSFPMFIRTTGREVVIVGGGEQAAQKARLALKTDACIRVVADELDPELAGLASKGRVEQVRGEVSPEVFRRAALVFVATGCPGADVAFHGLAKAAGALVNVVDRPELCDATTPSIVDRDPVVVAIGTEGTAPVLGRLIKTQIETLLHPRLGALSALAGRLRYAVQKSVPRDARRAFWAWVFKDEPGLLFRQGEEDTAIRLVKAAIKRGGAPTDAGKGHIALVGAGPGAKDLLTLRAVERLQEADIIFYDRLVDPAVLELARRDAERVFVGKEVGASFWPQEKICSLIVREAKKGRRVVRLKSGDPSIFGRASEELRSAARAGVPTEVVPGVTAALAAAATTGTTLTERGATDTLVLATGRCRPGDAHPDWAHHMRPGTTLAIYMGVQSAASVAQSLGAHGLSSSSHVVVCADVSMEGEKRVETSIADLPCALARAGISERAIIFVSIPKSAARRRAA